jgi:hypothetical protein
MDAVYQSVTTLDIAAVAGVEDVRMDAAADADVDGDDLVAAVAG